MAFTWTRDPLIPNSPDYRPEALDMTEIYTALNTIRVGIGLEALEVPTLAGPVLKTHHDDLRTALLAVESIASGTSYYVHNDAQTAGDTCETHDSSYNTTKNYTNYLTNNTSVSCLGHYATVNASYDSGYDSSVYSN